MTTPPTTRSSDPTTGQSHGAPSGPPDSTRPLEGRARQRLETRERLFETALREFREVGFGAAQIDRIARAAGVARGTFYFHFPTKDDVLLELARRINARVARRVAVVGASEPGLVELLNRVNDAIIDEHSRVGEAGLLSEMLSLYVRRPHDLHDPSHNLPTLADELSGHFARAIESGEIATPLAAQQIAIVYMTSLFGICTRIPAGEELRAAGAALVELFVNGLAARGRPPDPQRES